MKINEFIQFATENPVCFVATSEDNRPHVRPLLLFFADETGFYFETLSPKEFSKQLHNNPHVEVCFYNNPSELALAKSMRLRGVVEFISDPSLMRRAYEERKFLDDIVGKSVEPYLEIFKISNGDIHFWTMADVLKEQELDH